MRYRFIDAHKKAWPVNLMCSVLSVSRSGYYHWTGRGPSRGTQSNRDLDRRIREIFARHRQCYGVPRITDELHDEGIECSENRVARRMRALELKAILRFQIMNTLLLGAGSDSWKAMRLTHFRAKASAAPSSSVFMIWKRRIAGCGWRKTS